MVQENETIITECFKFVGFFEVLHTGGLLEW